MLFNQLIDIAQISNTFQRRRQYCAKRKASLPRCGSTQSELVRASGIFAVVAGVTNCLELTGR